MDEKTPDVTATFRIPGRWESVDDLAQQLPPGATIDEGVLRLEDGAEGQLFPMPADDQFPDVFESSCRRAASDEEMDEVRGATVILGVDVPVGSLQRAYDAMRVTATLVDSGGGGVFIDNTGLAHAANDWLAMTVDASLDAITFAYVSLIEADDEVTTMGMHVFGRPDFLMRTADAGGEGGDDRVVQMMRYLAAAEREVDVGHVLAVDEETSFRVATAAPNPIAPDGPMMNPFGRWRMINFAQIAESN